MDVLALAVGGGASGCHDEAGQGPSGAKVTADLGGGVGALEEGLEAAVVGEAEISCVVNRNRERNQPGRSGERRDQMQWPDRSQRWSLRFGAPHLHRALHPATLSAHHGR